MKNLGKQKQELVLQIQSLQRFYTDLGIDSINTQMIFKLVLDYLQGEADKLTIKSFFDTLVYQGKIENDKELDLLVCFDQLLDGVDEDFEQSDYRSAYYGLQIDRDLREAA